MKEAVVPQMTEINPIWFKLVGWPVKSLFVDSLDVYDDELKLAHRPFYEIRDRFDANGSMKPSNRGILGDLLAPALGAAVTAHNRNLAMIRSLRIAGAFAMYRQQHGSEASEMDELALPKEVTIDPFSGESLKLKHIRDNWVIYSVMQNGIDDGGDFKDQKDYGLAPRRPPEAK